MWFKELNYLGRHSAEHYFAPFVDAPYSLLLDSGGSDQSNNRYDIILVYPSDVLLRENDENIAINIHSGEKESVANVFDCMNNWLASVETPSFSSNEQLNCFQTQPFVGGLAGAFAYDLGRTLEKLPDNAINELKVPDLVTGRYWCPLIIDHQAQKVQLYNFYNLDDTFQRILNAINSFTAESDENINHFTMTSDWNSNLTQQDYAQKFEQVKNYIRSGDCYQINLAQRFEGHFTGKEWCAYQSLRKLNSAPFSAYLNFSSGTLMSLSPERFIEVKGRDVQTQPIKGTRPRGKTPEDDEHLKAELKNSAKDQAENLMIVDLLRNDLGRTAIAGSVEVTELFGVYSFPSVHHLISTVRSQINDTTSAIDVLKSAFPGGSITGAPKIRAMEIIEELEPHRRHFYCGSIAYFSFNDKMDSNILIRSIISFEQKLYTWAGGGLVNDSECGLEYDETFAKLSKILTPLNEL
ncbi:aminodeoxychorismate synthase component I [Pleionea sediminis]|uniref:aminodeoxychorismate synthase component I n=1 Tax=Pleionea sediminis TaxID=2569479 RepID=UPI00118671FE|nr:aminodeoxychorismate synthase component I [Pleionea sediminis]